jgi:hypothetical protein
VRRVELGGFVDLRHQPLTELAHRVLTVPVERRRELIVVPIPLVLAALLELRLRSRLRAHDSLLIVLVSLRTLRCVHCRFATVGPPNWVDRFSPIETLRKHEKWMFN